MSAPIDPALQPMEGDPSAPAHSEPSRSPPVRPRTRLRVIHTADLIAEEAEERAEARAADPGRARSADPPSSPPAHKRKRDVRPTTISVRHLKKAFVDTVDGDESTFDPASIPRPKTRGECVDGPRPCPWLSCVHHLYLDVSERGSIKLNFPDIEPHEMMDSCALDVADRGDHTLEKVAEQMNLVRERVRQIERTALAKLKLQSGKALRDAQAADDEPLGRDEGVAVPSIAVATIEDDTYDDLLDGVVRVYSE